MVAVELSREILLAARTGDRRAKQIVGTWMTDKLVGLYLAYGHPTDVAWDLSQQTMLEILEKIGQAPVEPEPFRDLVEKFATQTAKRKRSKDQRHANKLAAAHVYPRTPARRPDSLLGVRRWFARVGVELRKLRSPYRDTIGLTLEHDNHRQIADALGTSEQAVRWRVWRGRQMLRRIRSRS